jgi:hypothetical protein
MAASMDRRGCAKGRTALKPYPTGSGLFRRFIPDIEHRTTGEIVSHPDYARIRTIYIAHMLSHYEVRRFPGNWPSTAYRVAAIGVIVSLHASYDADDRSTWPTLKRFKDAAALIGLSSPRQLDDVIARLMATGHVTVERPATDRRLRFLQPTETMLTWDREWLCSYYDILQMLYPGSDYGIAVRREQEFYVAHRRNALKIFSVIAQLLMKDAALLPFALMNNGALVLMNLLLIKSKDPSSTVTETSFAGLMDRLGVSRSHIRNVIVAAEAHHLVERIGAGRKAISLTPRGISAIDRYIGDSLSSYDLTFRIAEMTMNDKNTKL